MTFSITGIIVGMLVGGVVTAVIALVWPRNRLRLLRPFAAALIGVAVAYMLMRLL